MTDKMEQWRPKEWERIVSELRLNLPLTPIDKDGIADPFRHILEVGVDTIIEAIKEEIESGAIAYGSQCGACSFILDYGGE